METDDALNLLISYNGYSDYVNRITDHIRGFKGEPIACPDWIRDPHTAAGWLWFILVCKFGDYGTSPRFGWIENKDGAMQFLGCLIGEEA